MGKAPKQIFQHTKERFSKGFRSKAMLIAPIISMTIFTVGNGLFTTSTTLQLHSLGISGTLIGIISSAYFIGMMLGAYFPQRFIVRVGQIRAYATFASITVLASLLQGLIMTPWMWIVLRAMCGFCCSSSFIVIESWCLHDTTPKNRGTILALYLFTYYLAQAGSQLLLRFHYSSNLVVFALVAMLSSLSVIPVCMTRFPAPHVDDPQISSPLSFVKKVPIGIFGAVTAGLILGNVCTILPLAFKNLAYSTPQIASLMFITMLGGTLLQYPIGKLSDHFDRRIILIIVASLCAILAFFVMLCQHFWTGMLTACFLFGGVAFVIYPLSISHATDFVEKESIVSLLAAISLSYGVGSSIGPILGTTMMHHLHTFGLFAFMGIVSVLFSLYTIYRMKKRPKAADPDQKTNFVPAAQAVVMGAEEVIEEQLNN